MRFFQKIGKIAVISVILIKKPNYLGKKIQKIGFFAKTSTNFSQILFLQIITCGYILAKSLKQLSFPHKQRWKSFTSYFFFQNHPHIIVENTENSPNFIILHNRTQISEKFSPIISKIGIFSSATSIVLHTKAQIAHMQNYQKQQLTAHTSIVKRIHGKVLQTHTFLLQSALLWSTGVSKSTNIHITKHNINKPCGYC